MKSEEYVCVHLHVPLSVAFTVQVKSTDRDTFFQGLFVQARTLQSDSYDTGTFDVLGDSQLQVVTCGSDTTNVSLSRRFRYQH